MPSLKEIKGRIASVNSSLCGGFNANVIKLMQKVVNDYCEQGATGVEIYPIGRKVAEKAGKLAMQTATDNADELLRELNLQYNKSRQQAITSELLDIVGGSVNN